MKKTIAIALAAGMALLSAVSVSAVPYELLVNTEEKQSISMYKITGNAPVIDGTFDADAWSDYLVTDAQTPDNINIVCENAFNDLSNEEWLENIFTPAQFYAAYDDTYVYIAAVTEDYEHACISTWEGDYADIRMWTKGTYEAAPKVVYNNGVTDPSAVVAGNTNGLEYAFGRDEASSITCYEYKIAWSDLTGGAQEEFALRISLGYGTETYVDNATDYPPFIGSMYFGYADLTKGERTNVATKESVFQGNIMIPSGEKPAPVVETEAEVVETPAEEAAAPQTFDAGIIAAVAVVISLGGFAVSKKHR